MNWLPWMKGHRFFLIQPRSKDCLRVRYVDDLRVNCGPEVDVTDDHEFALAIMDGLSHSEDAEDFTLCVFAEEV